MTDLLQTIHDAIQSAIPDGKIEVTGGGGHFQIKVTSPVFAGKRMLQQHRLVLTAIAHLMKGDNAPVHAVDSIECIVPE